MTGERLDRMEEDLRRLTKGLDTLNGVVVNLEERLRASLREDTKKILVSLLPNPPHLPDTTVEFGTLPDGISDGLEGGRSFPGFGDLEGRVTEVRDELRAKTLILEEIQVSVAMPTLFMSQHPVLAHFPLCNPIFSIGHGLGSRWTAQEDFGRSEGSAHPWFKLQ